MNDLQVMEDLCGVLKDLASVVEAQHNTLAMLDAVSPSDGYEAVRGRYTALLGDGEWPEHGKEEQA